MEGMEATEPMNLKIDTGTGSQSRDADSLPGSASARVEKGILNPNANTQERQMKQIVLVHAPIHFHTSDARFCGTKRQGRRITFQPLEVTCPVCVSKAGAVALSLSDRKASRTVSRLLKVMGAK